jgi:hypothetical protein
MLRCTPKPDRLSHVALGDENSAIKTVALTGTVVVTDELKQSDFRYFNFKGGNFS